jgi:zinc/manganese transport system ATP-binding protein
MVKMVLDVSGLTVRRDAVIAVDNVSFSLESETDTALVGPNGAGKSTLVQALLGILPPSAGSIRVLGHAMGPQGQLPRSVREQVAYVPQSFAVRNRCPLTVGDFVGLGWDPPGLRLPWTGGERRRSAVAHALRQTQATNLADRLISDLSGGQTKRVLLAFCLVRPRRLLVLDEAQAGLDSQSAEQFYDLLFELRRSEGWTILQISHDLDMVRRTSDRVLCLNRSLRCSGPPDHALSAARLEEVYGRGFVPYHHRHAP